MAYFSKRDISNAQLIREHFTIGKIATTIALVIMFFVAKYLCLPLSITSSLSFLGTAIFYFSFAILAITSIVTYLFPEDKGWSTAGIVAGVLLCIGIVVLVCSLFSNSAIFNSNKYYKQLGTVEEKEYKEEVSPLDLSQVPYINEDYAKILGNKVLGEKPDLGSTATIGDFNMQEVDGNLVLVAPLEHKGLFKYMKYKEGTPGYVIVSATNAEDVRLVTSLNGDDIKLRYQTEAYFGDDLIRHVISSGYNKEGITECTFELNDEGYPYWVITTYKNTIGLCRPEATGVIVVDPQTGDIEKYSVKEAPEWVDIIQPKSFVSAQIKNWGKYVKGAFNFSDEGKLKTTEGMDTIYNNGECYYYTGITSYGSDDSTNGFILVNTRTKETVKYNLRGANENAAQASAEGEVQNLEYTASFPLPVNIDGVPSYFMALKDKTGYVKKFAFVNVEHAQFVGIGDNIAEAKRAYVTKVQSNGNKMEFTDDAYTDTKEGIVSRISFTLVDGTSTMYLFTLDNDDKIYEVSPSVSSEVILTKPGDKIKIEYVDDNNGGVSIISFYNPNVYNNPKDEIAP